MTSRRTSRIACAASAFLAACSEAPSTLTDYGAPGGTESALGWFLVAVGSGIVLLIVILVLVASLRRRPPGHALMKPSHHNVRWIVMGGVVLPFVLLTATFFFTMGTLSAVANPSTSPGVTIRVTGHQYWWEVQYAGRDPSESFTTANELHIPVGVPVRLELVAGDVIHSFWVPQLAGKADLIPGQRNVMWIQAQRAGRYYGHCAEYCGAQHANMEIYVIAESQREFDAWRERERRAAQSPAQMGDTSGYAVFQRVGCANCHTIRGTTAGGVVGPDLTHLASRSTIGAGVLPNTRGNLAGWIANAQAIKPGVDMPTMGENISPTDLQHLLAYLETLR